jgi:DNA-binding MarR family transcriptional regulator
MQVHTSGSPATASDFCYDWRAMTTKLTPAAIEAWAALVRTEKVLLHKVEECLKAEGFPALDCYHVLYEVERAPKGMLRQSGVQDRTQLAQYSVCRLVDRLEREGLVERHQCQLDGRNNVLVITAKGRALRRAMWPTYAAAIAEYFGTRLSQAEAEQLVQLMNKLLPG